MRTPLQEHICSEYKSALDVFNNYLKSERTNFWLNDSTLNAIQFVFNGESSNHAITVQVENKLPDKYRIGRKLGEAYHKVRNTAFFNCGNLSPNDQKRHLKVRLVAEHTFAMLYMRSEESDINLESLIDTESAQDKIPKELRYSLMFNEPKYIPESDVDITEGKKMPKKSKNSDYFVGEFLRNAQERAKRQEEDNKYDPNQEKDFGANKDEFQGPQELEDYRKFEKQRGVSNDPFQIALDKSKREEFHLARTIVDGRGDSMQNWKTTVSEFLRQDLDTAIKYLKAILEY